MVFSSGGISILYIRSSSFIRLRTCFAFVASERQQQFRQRNAHLPSTGKLFGAALPILTAEAQTGQHRAYLRFDGVTIARAKLAFHAMEAVGDLRVFGAGVV